jgi:ABC-type glycerol-3-phosphate transport system substrate-binding protein
MLAVFMQQKAAMFYGGSWYFNPVKEGVKDFEWDVMQFPKLFEGASLAHGGGPNGAIIIPTFSDQNNLENTMKYVEYFTRPEVNQIVMNVMDPLVSCIKGVKVMDDPRAQKLNSEFLPNTVAFLDWIWPVEINDAFTQAIPAVMSGNMTPEQATDVIQKAFETLVKEKDYSYNWYDKFTANDWAKVTPNSIPKYTVK